MIPWAADHETGVIVYSPMASGLLSGTFDRGRLESLPSDDMRRGSTEFAEPWLSRNLALVEHLRAIADELGCSVAELAIAWTLAQDGVTGAIVGARRPDQLDGWIGAGDLELSPEVLRAMDDAIAETDPGPDQAAAPPRPSGDMMSDAGSAGRAGGGAPARGDERPRR